MNKVYYDELCACKIGIVACESDSHLRKNYLALNQYIRHESNELRISEANMGDQSDVVINYLYESRLHHSNFELTTPPVNTVVSDAASGESVPITLDRIANQRRIW